MAEVFGAGPATYIDSARASKADIKRETEALASFAKFASQIENVSKFEAKLRTVIEYLTKLEAEGESFVQTHFDNQQALRSEISKLLDKLQGYLSEAASPTEAEIKSRGGIENFYKSKTDEIERFLNGVIIGVPTKK